MLPYLYGFTAGIIVAVLAFAALYVWSLRRIAEDDEAADRRLRDDSIRARFARTSTATQAEVDELLAGFGQ